MMKLTLFVLILATTFLSTSVEGLAFVTGIMRPIVNPVAAFRRQRQVSAPIISTFLSTAATADDEVLAAVFAPVTATVPSAPKIGFGSDESTRACRSEMLDLVYQRSLDRMDSFAQ